MKQLANLKLALVTSMWNEDASEDEHTSTPSLKHLLELHPPPNVSSIVTIQIDKRFSGVWPFKEPWQATSYVLKH